MIAIARFAVQLPGEANATKEYTHRWMTEDMTTAAVELAEWQITEKPKIEDEEGWKMKLLDWHVEPRADIGY
jgi:hypothetical protein